MSEILEIFLVSVRDGFLQVSAFVAVTVLLFSYVQYRTGGRLVDAIEDHERAQPLIGALMGLTPGCGGAIVMMPLYVRGSISFGTVVATLVATAGDSVFVIIALAPEAGLYAYATALVAGTLFGYAIDRFGLGVGRVDAAVSEVSRATSTAASRVPTGSGVHHYEEAAAESAEEAATDGEPASREATGALWHLSNAALWGWWVAAAAGLVIGVVYLARGAPDIALTLGPNFAGAFTVVGLVGTTLSFYLYFVGRHHLGHGAIGEAEDTFENARETLLHASMETSFVTVWVIAAYLLYEYGIVFTGVDVAAAAAAAGVLAPIGGALIGVIPGCGPQIVLATAYAEGAIPFSALTANAISQDGDALFPLLAIDKTAAIVASIYTTIPALLVGVGMHLLYGPMFGFGVL